jgi:uncharacterized glyoxalase superfamily protein PhnB
MITAAHHVLAVHDFERTDAFYRDVLGFERFWGDGNWTFYRLGAALIMAGLCPDDLPPARLGSHSYIGYFEVDDVDAMYARIVERGGDITKEIHSEPWGQREFGVRSPEGHRWMFGQTIG